MLGMNTSATTRAMPRPKRRMIVVILLAGASAQETAVSAEPLVEGTGRTSSRPALTSTTSIGVPASIRPDSARAS